MTILNSLFYATSYLLINFIIGWIYFLIGLSISMIVEKFIYPNYSIKNTKDSTLLKIILIRLSFIIISCIIFIKLIHFLPIKTGLPFALINIGIFMMITDLCNDIRYLVDKYITKPIKNSKKIIYKYEEYAEYDEYKDEDHQKDLS